MVDLDATGAIHTCSVNSYGLNWRIVLIMTEMAIAVLLSVACRLAEHHNTSARPIYHLVCNQSS